jgi:hypothetical protein
MKCFSRVEFEVYVMCNGLSLYLDYTTRRTVERYLIFDIMHREKCSRAYKYQFVDMLVLGANVVSPRAVQFGVLRGSRTTGAKRRPKELRRSTHSTTAFGSSMPVS